MNQWEHFIGRYHLVKAFERVYIFISSSFFFLDEMWCCKMIWIFFIMTMQISMLFILDHSIQIFWQMRILGTKTMEVLWIICLVPVLSSCWREMCTREVWWRSFTGFSNTNEEISRFISSGRNGMFWQWHFNCIITYLLKKMGN